MEKCSLMVTRLNVGRLIFFFEVFFCNQWKSAAWWLQDWMSVVWASFKNFLFQPMEKCSLMVTRDNVGRVSFFFQVFFLQPMEKCSLMLTRESVGRLSFFFQVISFCNQWKSAAWWLQDRMSVVWDTFFKFSFSTNGKVQLDGYKIGCQLCELLFSSSFFCNQWKSAAWWLQDRMSVVWAPFFKFFFATNGRGQLDGNKIECR